MGTNIIVTVIVIVYLLFMLWIGWYSSTRISTNTDFMVAGRRLGPLLMAGTLAATEIGGGSSLGVVQNGMSGFGLSAHWYITTMGIAFIILSFIAPKFRAATVKTVPEYFRRRYGKSCGIITAIIMLLPLVGLTAGQFIASAVILSTMLSIDYQVAVIIVAMVVTVYSIMGGLWSVTLTDFVQVFLIVIGMIIAVPFAMNYAGGWGQVTANIPEGTLSMFQGYDLFGIISLVIMYTATFSVPGGCFPFLCRKGRKGCQGRRMAGGPGKLYLRLYPHHPWHHHPGINQYGQVQFRPVCRGGRTLRPAGTGHQYHARHHLRTAVCRNHFRNHVQFRLRPFRRRLHFRQ